MGLGIRVGDRNTANLRPARNMRTVIAIQRRIDAHTLEFVGVTVRPSIERNTCHIAFNIEAMWPQHAVEVRKNIALKILITATST